ncbi:hypothetical protein BJX70DRAFT_368156 [Aspergillus crustosus]
MPEDLFEAQGTLRQAVIYLVFCVMRRKNGQVANRLQCSVVLWHGIDADNTKVKNCTKDLSSFSVPSYQACCPFPISLSLHLLTLSSSFLQVATSFPLPTSIPSLLIYCSGLLGLHCAAAPKSAQLRSRLFGRLLVPSSLVATIHILVIIIRTIT